MWFIISSSRLIINGEEVWQPRLVPALASDAVPTQFPNVPKYLSKTLPKERKRKSRAPLQEPNRKARTLCQPSQLQSSQQYQQQTQEASSVYGDCDSPSGSLTAKTSTFRNLRRPSDYWSEQLFSEEPNTVSYQTVCLSNNTVPPLKFERAVIFEAQTAEGPSVCKVFLRGIPHLESSVGTPSQAEDILRYVDNVPLCAGVGELTEFAVVKIQEKSCQRVENKLYSNKCNGSVLGVSGHPCLSCKYLRKLLTSRMWKARRGKAKTNLTAYTAAKKLRRALRTLKRKKNRVRTLLDQINQTRAQNASISQETFEHTIAKLPPKQQESVRACFEASERKSLRGYRYGRAWLLECIILRMKSKRLYEHLRRHRTLVLPSRICLFSDSLFRAVKAKALQMDEMSRHGGLVLDEMKLAAHLDLTASSHIEGFVNLGQHTPEADKHTRADHGLVLMFQPFMGNWTQIIGK
ncbi:uncharacterized protein ISCGN_002691 [Ixodes scapularis]